LNGNGYAIITGNGRSGTNWLERLLDVSPDTHCRSEPYDIPVSAFNRAPQIWQPNAERRQMDTDWDEIIRHSRVRIGYLDHEFRYPKRYCHALAQRTGVVRLMAHGKSRKLLHWIHPEMRRGEWSMPWWVGSKQKLAQAYPVFKINMDRFMLEWLLDHRAGARILHIVRHPAGRLNSWLNRFLASRDPDQILKMRRERLHRIAKAEPDWRSRVGDIDAMTLVEAEVWFWRYVNESMYAAGQGRPGYMRIVYEELAQDPVAKAREVYAFCGVDWTGQVEATLMKEAKAETATSIASSWKSNLPAEHLNVIEHIVRDSPIMSWWTRFA
jgi:Sulfotransferase family